MKIFLMKILNYLVVTWILQPLNYYYCDKCQRFTRYEYQITRQPDLSGKVIQLKVPYCTRCVALEISKRKSKIKVYGSKIITPRKK